ncbi:hypothetical protein VRB69_10635 [Erwinia aphidicola]|uniref:hypothetical protein n=1 Tax=Erwinia aphidicola TaxID=68334 RepID=UPI0030D4E6C6
MIKTSLSLLLLLMASQALAAQLPAPLQAPAIPVDTRCSMSSNSREADLVTSPAGSCSRRLRVAISCRSASEISMSTSPARFHKVCSWW